MGKSWVLGMVTLVIIIAAIILSTENIDDIDSNFDEHVFFAKWQTYMGYALYEENGQIQLPFLDEYPNYNQFAGDIREVSLNFTHDFKGDVHLEMEKSRSPIKLSGFSIVGGNKTSGGKYSIRTMQIPFSIEREGIVKFDELSVIMSSGKIYTWQVGQWEIEIKDLLKYDDFEQGDRGFAIDPVPKFYFEMINKTQEVLRCDALVYGETILNELLIDLSLCEAETEGGYTKMIIYCDEAWIASADAFYYIKPFLQYYVGDEKRIAPLKEVDFSGLFTTDSIRLILENRGKME
ncbi:hypothetical protein [Fusibacter ferrireducens]|uniref:DUF5643 domain-containing protein n=1 Tax=Fusibacter ferrireducens TaxID=2785058 RepID=A0ABR9ZVN8_9FIRM|nr:hypothetical protein [Fusibacter ferrireducens]MBF4694401.1 hypothetical protein [Fusibacter ferrireducens]